MQNKINVLIVDDRRENLLALESVLSDQDITIYKALSGNEALGLLVEHDFALVLLDVQMPHMDGFEMAELMRIQKRLKHIPIIFTTAINREQHHVFKGYETGAVDYLFKPIDPEILQAKVKFFCELHRQKKIIQQQRDDIARKKELLQKQLDEIKTLRGLLPICCNCKKIRNDEGYWEIIEIYIRDRSEADFSHCICPKCCRELYPDLSFNQNNVTKKPSSK